MSSHFTTSCIWNITATEEWQRIFLVHRTSTWCVQMTMSISLHRLLKMKAGASTTGFTRMTTCRHVENHAALMGFIGIITRLCLTVTELCCFTVFLFIIPYAWHDDDHVRTVRGTKVSYVNAVFCLLHLNALNRTRCSSFWRTYAEQLTDNNVLCRFSGLTWESGKQLQWQGKNNYHNTKILLLLQ